VVQQFQSAKGFGEGCVCSVEVSLAQMDPAEIYDRYEAWRVDLPEDHPGLFGIRPSCCWVISR
jgi:hypothetical protein